MQKQPGKKKTAKPRRPRQPAGKRNRGRPTAYSPKKALRILELAAAGKTEDEIADAVGISRTTLKAWKAAHLDFLAALKEAKATADDLVEAALFQRAVGYEASAVKFFCHEGVVISKRYVERYEPDTTAAIFWLKNRRPDKWRDTKSLEHAGKDGGPIKMEATAKEVDDAVRKALSDAAEPTEDY